MNSTSVTNIRNGYQEVMQKPNMKATFWKAGFNTMNAFQGLRLFREIIQTKPEDLEKASNEH